MPTIKDILDNLKEFKRDVKEDIASVNTSINLVAIEVKGVKTEVGNLKEQVGDQSKDIRMLSKSNILIEKEVEYAKKKLKENPKRNPMIPSTILKNSWAKKIYFFLAVGTVGAIALLGYLAISKIIKNSDLVSNFFQ